MAFYDLSKPERIKLVAEISDSILGELKSARVKITLEYFKNEDTYIRKSAYLSIGRLYFSNAKLQSKIIMLLAGLQIHDNFKIRQTVINAAGEIGKRDFKIVEHFFDKGLFDVHHAPRNAVIGSVKKMGDFIPMILGIIITLQFISVIGIWHMKQWGVQLFILMFFTRVITFLLLDIYTFQFFFNILYSLFFTIFFLIYYKQMDKNL